MQQRRKSRWAPVLRLWCVGRFVSEKIWKDESGNVLLLTALSFVALCGFGALAIDVGMLMAKQQEAQTASDAAALAGASALLQGPQTAANTAYQYASMNDPHAQFTVTADSSSQTVNVQASQQVPLWLARVLGHQNRTINAHSVAKTGVLVSGTGMVPLAVPNQQFTYGEEYELSDGAGTGQSGNYGFLDLSGQGANGLESDLEHGYSMSLFVGEQVPTKPGVMSGPVQTAIDYRMSASANDAVCTSYTTVRPDCSRMMYLPVIDSLAVNGKKDVTIVGFAAFYLEGLQGNGGHQEIIGRFLHMIRPGRLGVGTDYGTEAVKLSN